MSQMVNENEKAPTYEELENGYQQLAVQAHELEKRYQILLQDRTLEKIKVLSAIVEKKELYSEKILKLVEWHLTQMLAKPKA